MIFVLTLGYDLWYYILGHSGLVPYEKNDDLQKVRLQSGAGDR